MPSIFQFIDRISDLLQSTSLDDGVLSGLQVLIDRANFLTEEEEQLQTEGLDEALEILVKLGQVTFLEESDDDSPPEEEELVEASEPEGQPDSVEGFKTT
jgi:hypothetical protein